MAWQEVKNANSGKSEIHELITTKFSGRLHYTAYYGNEITAGFAVLSVLGIIFILAGILAAVLIVVNSKPEELLFSILTASAVAVLLGLMGAAFFWFNSLYTKRIKSSRALLNEPSYQDEYHKLHEQWLAAVKRHEAPDDLLFENAGTIYRARVTKASPKELTLITEPTRSGFFEICVGLVDVNENTYNVGDIIYVAGRVDVHFSHFADKQQSNTGSRAVYKNKLAFRLIDLRAMQESDWDWQRLVPSIVTKPAMSSGEPLINIR